MRALRWTGASLLVLVGGLLALVGVLLCVTVLLAPLGIPLLFLARRILRAAGDLVVPRQVRHPIEAIGQAGSAAADEVDATGRKGGHRRKRARPNA
jgi:hypothetical protein